MKAALHEWCRRAGVLAAVGATLGCAQVGPARGDPGPRVGASVVQGEVRSVNTRSARIQLRDAAGRTRNVRYDDRTQVVYRRQAYPVTALRQGDRVSVRVAPDRGNRVRAVRIDVHDAGAARGAARARVQRLDGTVGWVDTRRGAFSVALDRRRSATVLVPGNLSSADQRRFARLRRGDRVRADVRPIGRDQLELVRFR